MINALKEIAPGIITVIFTAVLFWLSSKLKKIFILVNQIPDIKCDIKDMKQLSMHTFKRMDAQDSATIQLFQSIKNQKVNGEASEAIRFMTAAKIESDTFIENLFFEDNCSKSDRIKNKEAK